MAATDYDLSTYKSIFKYIQGPFKCYVTQMGVGGVRIPRKKHYKGVRFNVI